MGFLHKLWDETLAGPAPETGLGKLRKYNSFAAATRSPAVTIEDVPISRSITIVRTHSNFRTTTNSEPTSPSAPISLAPRQPRRLQVGISKIHEEKIVSGLSGELRA